MDYQQAKKAIASTTKLGSRLGLQNITRLCALLGNPQDALKYVHVAGTNGKGSTCAMIASALHAADIETGLYLSPYLEVYRDSYYFDGQMIGERDFADVVTEVFVQVEKMNAEGLHPTEFEILTAVAFVWFARNNCEMVVLETGMGGRLDATNVVKNTLVSVITAITRDHTAFLGNTIAQITREKCGVIKTGGVTVCYPEQDIRAREIIKKTAEEKENALIIPDMGDLKMLKTGLEGTHILYGGLDAHVSLAGDHQARNAITAIEATKALRGTFDIGDNAIRKGLQAATLPARLEIIRRQPLVLLDGGHNLQGIQALARWVKNHLGGKRIIVVMGMLADKEYGQAIEIMAGMSEKFIAIEPDSDRALDAKEAAKVARAFCGDVQAFDDISKAVGAAISASGTDGAVVICGSLYMVRAVKAAINRL